MLGRDLEYFQVGDCESLVDVTALQKCRSLKKLKLGYAYRLESIQSTLGAIPQMSNRDLEK